MKSTRIHQFGIVWLMLTKPWLYSMLDGSSIYISVRNSALPERTVMYFQTLTNCVFVKIVPFEFEIVYIPILIFLP